VKNPPASAAVAVWCGRADFCCEKKRANNFHRIHPHNTTQHSTLVKWKRRARWQFVVSTLRAACCFVFVRGLVKRMCQCALGSADWNFHFSHRSKAANPRRVRMENEHGALLPALFLVWRCVKNGLAILWTPFGARGVIVSLAR
jgi:hypothetical protein